MTLQGGWSKQPTMAPSNLTYSVILFITSKTPLWLSPEGCSSLAATFHMQEPCEIHKDSSLWGERKLKKQVPPNVKLDNSVIFCLLGLLMEIIKSYCLRKVSIVYDLMNMFTWVICLWHLASLSISWCIIKSRHLFSLDILFTRLKLMQSENGKGRVSRHNPSFGPSHWLI